MKRSNTHINQIKRTMSGDRLRAFTLIELLVVMAIMSLLISILLPALSGARNEGTKAKCLANLSNLCKVGAAYAVDNTDNGAMLAMPTWWKTGGFTDTSGFYDYGGGNGMEDGQGAFGYQALSQRDCRNRPLNQYVFGVAGVSANSDFSMFQCPTDFGWVDAPYYATDSWRPEWKTRPFWRSTGTSYRANAARAVLGSTYSTISPYAQPVTKIPAPSETVLYSESIHWLGIWNSTSFADRNGSSPATIPGWHGKMGRFNIGFVDGHAGVISMEKSGVDALR